MQRSLRGVARLCGDDDPDQFLRCVRWTMAKKITVYTVLIVLIVALLLVNVYMINLSVWRFDEKDRVLSEFTRYDNDDVKVSFSIFKYPENAEGYDLKFGMVDVGECLSFYVESESEDVLVELYIVDKENCRYSDELSCEPVSTDEFRDYMKSLFMSGNVYEDGTTEIRWQTGMPEGAFIVIHGGDARQIIAEIFG